MIEVSNKRMSRHFTVVVRREFPMSVEKIFSAWTNPEIRRSVLAHGRYKNGVKEVDVSEGGKERYEDRWKNRLYGTTTRRYILLRPARMIVAHSETSVEGDMFDQHFVRQELLLFKPKGEICEIVASTQCVSIEPTFVHAAEDSLKLVFDIFADKL
ncbi:SRPBCC domain-containing protein [Jannaschia donghaensis]|uniref:SRPBCC domain-containing protein n=1 Tax=Jannaschia donghaensis TaxID=420998 RepID=UPI001187581C|nr:SRPBCC domain-containing protein [Jannaschia donghaensis]